MLLSVPLFSTQNTNEGVVQTFEIKKNTCSTKEKYSTQISRIVNIAIKANVFELKYCPLTQNHSSFFLLLILLTAVKEKIISLNPEKLLLGYLLEARHTDVLLCIML